MRMFRGTPQILATIHRSLIMRAFAVQRFGEAPAIHDLPMPSADGAFLIRVGCAGVNPFDSVLVDRLTATSVYPFVVGADFAGVVERAAPGQREFQNGDRIFGIARTHGAYAEYTAVAPGVASEPLARIPDGITDEQAAALPIPGITALGALELMHAVSGQRIVIMGATGGVGGYAVQMARARGAHVIATVRGDPDEARRLGAEEVYDTNDGDVFAAVHAAHPDGVDSAFDLVDGADTIRRVAEFLKPGGSLVSTRYAADEKWFAERRITAHNISSMTNALSSTKGLSELARMLVDGTITARIGTTVGLDGAGSVLDQLRRGKVQGKAIIRISPPA
jgi:NADPH:quinone reductase-like Zn-dependent oxidoreductase